MTIVLFGEDLFTAAALQALLDHGHTVAAVICPFYRGNPEYRSLEKSAVKNGVPFFHTSDVNDGEIRDLLMKIAPELIVSVHLRKILLKAIYSLSSRGAINVHPSLLPKYRGLSPQHQALLHGDTETGVTIHLIEETVDTGDIILQEKIPMTGDMTIYDLQMKLLAVYRQIIPEAVKRMASDSFIPGRQNTANASWFGPLKDSERKIDLKNSKFAIYNLVRAVSKPYRGAYYNNITVWSCRLPDMETEKRYLMEFADTGIYICNDNLIIRLADAVLLSDDFEIATT